MKNITILLAVSLIVISSPGQSSAGPDEDFGAAVIQFGAARHKLEEELGQQFSLPISTNVQEFFRAAEASDWLAVSNRFQKLLIAPTRPGPVRELRNELWSPILETLGLYEAWAGWKKNAALLNAFAAPILDSMPTGSVYFGGTDEGRFLVTARNTLQHPSPVLCLTQNALADSTYVDYLRAIYGKQLWIPAKTDLQNAFQEYVLDARARVARGQALGPDEGVEIIGGRVQVTGVKSVMNINAIICRQIHEHNKDQHEFYIQESYVINWMYPYLEPHGLIMKLNKEPLPELSAAIIARDMDFWKATTETLLKQPGFADNLPAQLSFAKLRNAIAGIYEFRKRDDEAERVYLQALQLCSSLPEANLGLAKLYARRGQVDRAVDLLQKFIPTAKDAALTEAKASLKAIEKMRPLTADERQLLTGWIQQLGSNQASERRAAQRQLADFGPRAAPLLREQANSHDIEVKSSIDDLLQSWHEDNVNGASDSGK